MSESQTLPEKVIYKKVTVIDHEDENYSLSKCALCVPIERIPLTGKKVGIDVEISELLGLSNGDVHDNKRFYTSTPDKLIIEQQNFSGMAKGSNNSTNYSHKLSKELIEEYKG